MARLPTVGGDYGNWGTVLNEYLETAHNADGTLKLDVQTIDDLKAIDVATLTDKQQALVAGYSAPGDGGGGVFYFDAAASTADNGGTIFAPSAGSGRWFRNYSGPVNVKWFGAKGDDAGNGSGADDTLAIQAAVAIGEPVVFPSRGGLGYRITDTITSTSGFIVDTDTFLYYNGPADRSVLVLTPSRNDVCAVALRSATATAWSNTAYRGVVLRNLYAAAAEIREVNGSFYRGLVLEGDGAGCSLSTIRLGLIQNSKYAVTLSAVNSGYVNENLVLGGELRCQSSFKSGEERVAISIESPDISYLNNNNNVFIKPSCELNTAGGAAAVCVNISAGITNRFISIRSESNTVEARFSGTASYNYVETGYLNAITTPRVETTSTAQNWVVNAGHHTWHRWTNIFDSGSIPNNVFFYDGTDANCGVRNMFVMSTDTALISHAKVNLAYDVGNTPSYVSIEAGIGLAVRVDSSSQKKFRVRRRFADASYGRLAVKPYASDGSERGNVTGDLLTPTGTGYTWTAGFGGAWWQTADSSLDFVFEVGASVDYFDLMVVAGSNEPHIKWLAVQCEGAAQVYTPFAHLYAAGALLGTAAPTSGNWLVGQVVRNVTPAPGGYAGWICTSAGSPGTWKGFGTIEG